MISLRFLWTDVNEMVLGLKFRGYYAIIFMVWVLSRTPCFYKMIILDYFSWHYSKAITGIMVLMADYANAIWHRFLVVQHLKTLFAPWHRRQPSEFSKGDDFSTRVLDALADFYIRLLAALMRTIIILSGLIFEIIVFAGFVLILIAWILWPVLLVYSVVHGANLLL